MSPHMIDYTSLSEEPETPPKRVHSFKNNVESNERKEVSKHEFSNHTVTLTRYELNTVMKNFQITWHTGIYT